MASDKPITRVTFFKIPDPADQQKLINMYKEMPKKATKNGKPYILSVTAGSTFDDQRNQGFTVAVISSFASLEDFEYYDKECEAHAALKPVANSMHQGIMMAYFNNAVA
ncbi:hypothetical protein BGW36DRAFT_376622 [Talaromyces proteolyticus]|uniref:Stress-response A/B barrel domain-containing protein n=1 Tax=Talaromyces proteolyticus TaxID=1131652 RepID=A0AAD4Q1P2_9EURO|nr:uncharacterized protein BGW36DRAFT_376622 [Talaromyces proteolyticus]KAH8698700.1 hypothetical protein BGW36DRAFT_376622 [Talaromyces proteolyticus]